MTGPMVFRDRSGLNSEWRKLITLRSTRRCLFPSRASLRQGYILRYWMSNPRFIPSRVSAQRSHWARASRCSLLCISNTIVSPGRSCDNDKAVLVDFEDVSVHESPVLGFGETEELGDVFEVDSHRVILTQRTRESRGQPSTSREDRGLKQV